MAKAHEIDLQLEWFCSGDLIFTYNEEMKYDVSLFTPTNRDQTQSVAPFLILKRQHHYKIGQLYDFEYNSEANEYTGNKLRHPSLVRQDYNLPFNIPARGDFFGPMHAVNMMRIIRAVQAKLMNDQEVRTDVLTSLREYYEEKLAMSQPVVQLNFRRA